MAFKNIGKINAEIEELAEMNNKINQMKEEVNNIEYLHEYNEQVRILNKMVDEYNERRNQLKSYLSKDI